MDLNQIPLTLTAAVTNYGLLKTMGGGTVEIEGNVANSGSVSVGGVNAATGTLKVTGNFTQVDGGTLQVYGQGSKGNFSNSLLNVSATATLAGNFATAGGTADPQRKPDLTVITAASVTGTFRTTAVTWGKFTWNIDYPAAATSVLLQVLDGTIQTSGSAYEQIAGQAPGEWEWLYTFSDGAAPGLTIYDYTFQLEWGDGAVSTWTENDPASDMMIVQVSGATNEYQIYGAHTYADPGYYTVTLTVTDDFSVVSWEAANQWILVDQG